MSFLRLDHVIGRHLRDQAVAAYGNIPNVKNVILTPVLVYVLTAWAYLTIRFVSSYRILFSVPTFRMEMLKNQL